MADGKGYFKCYRRLAEWEWFKDSAVLHVFILCLIKANTSEKTWKGVTIRPGEFVSSVRQLSEETGLSTQQVRTALKKLHSTNELASKTTNKYTLFKVNKFAEWQGINKQPNKQSENSEPENASHNFTSWLEEPNSEISTNKKEPEKPINKDNSACYKSTANNPVTNNQQTNNKQITTTKNNENHKNHKNQENFVSKGAEPQPSNPHEKALEVLAYWNERTGQNATPATQGFAYLVERLAEGNSIDVIKRLIDRKQSRIDSGGGDRQYMTLGYSFSKTGFRKGLEYLESNSEKKQTPGLPDWYADTKSHPVDGDTLQQALALQQEIRQRQEEAERQRKEKLMKEIENDPYARF